MLTYFEDNKMKVSPGIISELTMYIKCHATLFRQQIMHNMSFEVNK